MMSNRNSGLDGGANNSFGAAGGDTRRVLKLHLLILVMACFLSGMAGAFTMAGRYTTAALFAVGPLYAILKGYRIYRRVRSRTTGGQTGGGGGE